MRADLMRRIVILSSSSPGEIGTRMPSIAAMVAAAGAARISASSRSRTSATSIRSITPGTLDLLVPRQLASALRPRKRSAAACVAIDAPVARQVRSAALQRAWPAYSADHRRADHGRHVRRTGIRAQQHAWRAPAAPAAAAACRRRSGCDRHRRPALDRRAHLALQRRRPPHRITRMPCALHRVIGDRGVALGSPVARRVRGAGADDQRRLRGRESARRA